LEALSSLESLMQAAFVAAALVVALWSARRSLAATSSRRTGEIVWSIVAVATLVSVLAAVNLGGGRGL
jgi:hypothetical protein